MWEYSFDGKFAKVYYEHEDINEQYLDISDPIISILQQSVFNAVRKVMDSLREVSSTVKQQAFRYYNGKVISYSVFLEVPGGLFDVLKVYGYGVNSNGVKINHFAVVTPSYFLKNKIKATVYINNEKYKVYILPLVGNTK